VTTATIAALIGCSYAACCNYPDRESKCTCTAPVDVIWSILYNGCSDCVYSADSLQLIALGPNTVVKSAGRLYVVSCNIGVRARGAGGLPPDSGKSIIFRAKANFSGRNRRPKMKKIHFCIY